MLHKKSQAREIIIGVIILLVVAGILIFMSGDIGTKIAGLISGMFS